MLEIFRFIDNLFEDNFEILYTVPDGQEVFKIERIETGEIKYTVTIL